jgi:hypothetical protein
LYPQKFGCPFLYQLQLFVSFAFLFLKFFLLLFSYECLAFFFCCFFELTLLFCLPTCFLFLSLAFRFFFRLSFCCFFFGFLA